MIQEDGYAFDAKVEVNEPNRQIWRTIKQEANKVDEWEWTYAADELRHLIAIASGGENSR